MQSAEASKPLMSNYLTIIKQVDAEYYFLNLSMISAFLDTCISGANEIRSSWMQGPLYGYAYSQTASDSRCEKVASVLETNEISLRRMLSGA
ncbi:MAG: hypothetical protein JNL51_12550 [Chitinophagaceae bacterium]|nr:hypothetical protein [Chitinophagaceae bacterium]